MKKFIWRPAEHVPDDIAPLTAQVALGDNIMQMLRTKQSNPLVELLDRAQGEYIDALGEILHADLVTADGISKARIMQAKALRYFDLVRWIADALEAAGAAEEVLALEDGGELSDEIQEAINDQSGRKRPAPDA